VKSGKEKLWSLGRRMRRRASGRRAKSDIWKEASKPNSHAHASQIS